VLDLAQVAQIGQGGVLRVAGRKKPFGGVDVAVDLGLAPRTLVAPVHDAQQGDAMARTARWGSRPSR
jgi:hypothetical protein